MWTLAPSVSFDADAVLIIIGSSWLPTADAVRVGLLYPGTRVQNCPEEQKEESAHHANAKAAPIRNEKGVKIRGIYWYKVNNPMGIKRLHL